MAGWTIVKDSVRVLENAKPEQVYQYFGITDPIPMIEVENKYRQLGYRLMFRM